MKRLSVLLFFILLYPLSAYPQGEAQSTREENTFMWALLGPNIINSNQQYVGTTFSAGMSFYPKPDHIWSFGFFLGKPSSDEQIHGLFQGSINRYDVGSNLRYQLSGGPFFVTALVGASYIACSQEQAVSRLDPLYGIGVGYVLMKSKLQELNLQLNYEYVNGQISPFPYSVGSNQQLGDGSVSTVMSAASITTLALSYGFFL